MFLKDSCLLHVSSIPLQDGHCDPQNVMIQSVYEYYLLRSLSFDGVGDGFG